MPPPPSKVSVPATRALPSFGRSQRFCNGSLQSCPGAILRGFWPGSRAGISNPSGARVSWLAGSPPVKRQPVERAHEHDRASRDRSGGDRAGRSSPRPDEADGARLGGRRELEAQLCQGARRSLPLRCQPTSHPRSADGVAGGDEQALALYGQCPALGDAQAGHGSPSQRHAGRRRVREFDRGSRISRRRELGSATG